jgi:hypothetical protein
MNEDEPLWTHEQVAEYLGISVNTLKHRRAGTRRLPRVTLGKLVKYRPQDVRDFCQRLAMNSVTKPGVRRAS